MISQLERLFAQLIADGGFVLFPLLGCAALAWWGIGARWAILRNPSCSDQQLLEQSNTANGVLEDFASALQVTTQSSKRHSLFVSYAHKLDLHKSLIISVIAIAPLLGLLGTVTGMIETFKGIGQSTLFSQSGGVAGGIAEALLTTQMGLVVATPAILVSRGLERKADVLRNRMINLMALANRCED